jgi:hypothetical protein
MTAPDSAQRRRSAANIPLPQVFGIALLPGRYAGPPGDAPGRYAARVRREQCSFEGVAFRQRISPEMTYVLDRDSFALEDILYGENGQPLFPPSDLLRVQRVSQ